MKNIEYGNKLIRLGKLMKSDKTKLKDLVGAALDCGLIYSFGLTPQPEGSVELDLNKPDTPYPVTAAVQLAKNGSRYGGHRSCSRNYGPCGTCSGIAGHSGYGLQLVKRDTGGLCITTKRTGKRSAALVYFMIMALHLPRRNV